MWFEEVFGRENHALATTKAAEVNQDIRDKLIESES
jgi:hypothetical protein